MLQANPWKRTIGVSEKTTFQKMLPNLILMSWVFFLIGRSKIVGQRLKSGVKGLPFCFQVIEKYIMY